MTNLHQATKPMNNRASKFTLTLSWRMSFSTIKTGLAATAVVSWLWCVCSSTVVTLQTSSTCKQWICSYVLYFLRMYYILWYNKIPVLVSLKHYVNTHCTNTCSQLYHNSLCIYLVFNQDSEKNKDSIVITLSGTRTHSFK